jgi:hypothetical protein
MAVNGAWVAHRPRDAPGGRNLTARNPDGLIVEYYEPARDRWSGAFAVKHKHL